MLDKIKQKIKTHFHPNKYKDIKFEKLNIHQILEICGAEQAKMEDIFQITSRLYDIAYFDDDILDNERVMAAHILETAKSIIIQACQKNNFEAYLQRATKAWEHSEKMARQFGYGTLYWIFEKTHPNDIFEFMFRDEYKYIVGDFISILIDSGNYDSPRASIIKNLIRHRRISYESNAVLILYALATMGDQATLALFNLDEIECLLKAPGNYNAARQMLSSIEILPLHKNAKQFIDSEKIRDALSFIVSQIIDDLLQSEMLSEKVEVLSGKMKNITREVVRVVVFSDIFEMLKSTFNEEVMLIFRESFTALSLPKFSNVSEDLCNAGRISIESIRSENKSILPLNIIVLMRFLEDEEIDLKDKEMEKNIETANFIIGHARCIALEKVRHHIRYISGETDNDTDIEFNDEQVNLINQLYYRYGSKIGKIEQYTFLEDWVGSEK